MRRINEVVRTVVGACAVYGIVAACSGADRAQSVSSAGGSSSTGGAQSTGGMGSGATSGTGGTRDGSTMADAVADALTDPVPDADAQEPTGPEVHTVPCDIEQDGLLYAAQNFPGLGPSELARVHTIGAAPSANDVLGVSYTHRDVHFRWLAEDWILASCGGALEPTVTSVTFVKD